VLFKFAQREVKVKCVYFICSTNLLLKIIVIGTTIHSVLVLQIQTIVVKARRPRAEFIGTANIADNRRIIMAAGLGVVVVKSRHAADTGHGAGLIGTNTGHGVEVVDVAEATVPG
jgi:hypothetical protein